MIRVHFVHGLEGHGRGSKVLALESQGFEVRAPEMHMSLWGLRKHNSMARNLLRLPETRAVAGLSLAGLASGLRRRSGARLLASLALPAGWFALRKRALASAALRRSYEACLHIQREALSEGRPDVLVGSSWGGAIAIDLLREGTWGGPTVLLAPAWARVQAWTGVPSSPGLHPGDGDGVVLFHDPSDEVVPLQDSVRLAAGTRVDARFVQAGGHRLMGLLESGELAATLRELVGR